MAPDEQGISIQTPAQSIILNAGKDIMLGALVATDSNGPSSSVTLVAEGGDIQIGYISTGQGGIDISTPGSFRAVDSFFDEGATQTFPLPPEFISFLINEGYYSSEAEVLSSGVLLEGDRLVSLLVKLEEDIDFLPEGSVVPISIRYGDATQTVVDESYTSPDGGATIKLLILGDSVQPFVVGPQYDNDIVFKPRDPNNSVANFNPDDPFTFVFNDSVGLTFPSDDFPPFASGLSAGISVRSGFNANLYGGLQTLLFVPPPPTLPQIEETASSVCDNFQSAPPSNETLLVIDESLLPSDYQPIDNTPLVEPCDS